MLDILLGEMSGFVPHGYCLRWDPWLLARYVISDAVIGLSYYSIPIVLLHFSKRHPELRFNLVFVLFAAFIFACGTTHFVEILNIWWPAYQLQAWIKVITAVISVTTAIALLPLAPRMSAALTFHQQSRERQEALNEELTAANESLAASNEALAQSEELFRLTVQNAPIGLATVGLDGRFLSVNRTLCEIVGYPEIELRQKSFQDITHPQDLQADLAKVEDLIAGRADHYRMQKRYLHRDGHVVDIQLDVAILRSAQGEPLQFVSQIQDITQRLEEGRQLEVRASTDDLTGLPNRRAFYDEGRRMLARAQRQNQELALVMMDLDHFKTINDTYGHASGDRVLRAIKDAVQPRLREGDLLARLGGEEFAILLPNASPPYARFIAERIRESIESAEINALDGRPIPLTTSLGLATIAAGEKMETAMERADQALYQAKTEGRNRVVEAPASPTS